MMTGSHFALGIAYVMREEQHIRIDFLYDRFSPRVKSAIDLVINTGFLFPTIAWMTWLLIDKAVEAYLANELSGESEWNPVVWPVYYTVAFGFVVFTLQIFADTVKRARSLFAKKPEA
jgi:TRAP-type mannitol/chloroaromatic compound transport system permease small subunit